MNDIISFIFIYLFIFKEGQGDVDSVLKFNKTYCKKKKSIIIVSPSINQSLISNNYNK